MYSQARWAAIGSINGCDPGLVAELVPSSLPSRSSALFDWWAGGTSTFARPRTGVEPPLPEPLVRLPTQRQPVDSNARTVRGDHAVVLGGSMAGLLAARVLADHYEQVTLVERDVLPDEGRPRRGVPQSRHAHVLLPRGARSLEELFPGLLRELVDRGAPTADRLSKLHLELNGHLFFHGTEPAEVVAARLDGALYEPSRPLLESVVLRRIRGLPNVEILDGHDVASLLSDRAGGRVTGARIVARDDRAATRYLAADLVVSATGRSGRATAWLKELGYSTPVEEELAVDLMYVTQHLHLPRSEYDEKRAVLAGTRPDRPHGAGAFAQEDDTWVVTLLGYGGHHPPMDRERWLQMADEVLPQGLARAVRGAKPIGGLVQHRFPTNLRRRYDKLHHFPDGFLVTGDALCSFNPVYGQGMTVAALEALAMDAALTEGEDHLAQRFFRAAARPIADAWRFATGGDLAMPPTIVPGPRPLPARAVNAYVDRFQAAAEGDPVMAWRFLDVTGFEQPASALFSGDSLRRIATGARRRTTSALAGAGGQWP